MKKLVSILGIVVCFAAAVCMTGCVSSSDTGNGGEKPGITETEKLGGKILYTVSVKWDDESAYAVKIENAFDVDDCTLTVPAGETVAMNTLVEAYSDWFKLISGFYRDHNLYTDEACRTKFVGKINGDTNLYYSEYNPVIYGRIVFYYDGEEYVVCRAIGDALSAADFYRSAYGIGEASDYVFYSDEARTKQLNINKIKVPKDPLFDAVVIYVGDVE